MAAISGHERDVIMAVLRPGKRRPEHTVSQIAAAADLPVMRAWQVLDALDKRGEVVRRAVALHRESVLWRAVR